MSSKERNRCSLTKQEKLKLIVSSTLYIYMIFKVLLMASGDCPLKRTFTIKGLVAKQVRLKPTDHEGEKKMKFVAELEGNKDAVLAVLQQAGVKIINVTEIALVNFGAVKPCPNRSKTSGYSDRWAVGTGEGQPKTCSECGASLSQQGEGYSASYTHADEGSVPDYGKPEPIPTGANVARYDRMASDCGRIFLTAFYADGRLTAVKEIDGQYHKNGKWSYSELSVVAPETAILLCVTRSTHSNSNGRRYLKFQDKEAFIGKLSELDRLPDAKAISQQLGVEVTPEALERIALYNTSLATRQRWAELKQLTSVKTF